MCDSHQPLNGADSEPIYEAANRADHVTTHSTDCGWDGRPDSCGSMARTKTTARTVEEATDLAYRQPIEGGSR